MKLFGGMLILAPGRRSRGSLDITDEPQHDSKQTTAPPSAFLLRALFRYLHANSDTGENTL